MRYNWRTEFCSFSVPAVMACAVPERCCGVAEPWLVCSKV